MSEHAQAPSTSSLQASLPSSPPGDLPPDEIPALFTPAHDPAERRKLWLLVAFVLALAVIPDLHWAIHSWLAEPPAPDSVLPAMSIALHLLERSFRVVVPMVCLLAIIGFPFRSMGLWRIRAVDFSIAVAMLIVIFPTTYLLGWLASIIVEPRFLGHTAPPGSAPEWLIVIFADVVNAVAEELAIWGVLYVCLRRLWHRSEWLSLLVAALTFGSYHIYQGIDGVILVTTMGLLHGAFFRLTRRLWPLIIAHAANNIFITLAATFPMISLTGS